MGECYPYAEKQLMYSTAPTDWAKDDNLDIYSFDDHIDCIAKKNIS